MTDKGVVTWKWIASTAISILLLGISAWITVMYAEVNGVKREQVETKADVSSVRGKMGVIEEQLRRTREDIQEIKDVQKDINKKLDELLRRR